MARYSMTFQFSDDSGFSSNLVEITVGVLGVKDGETPVGEATELWDNTKIQTRRWRDTYAVQLYPAAVTGHATENDNGTIRLLRRHFQTKPYCRIYETDLPRVTRGLVAAADPDPDTPDDFEAYWPTVTPLQVELESYSSSEWNQTGLETTTLNLYVPSV